MGNGGSTGFGFAFLATALLAAPGFGYAAAPAKPFLQLRQAAGLSNGSKVPGLPKERNLEEGILEIQPLLKAKSGAAPEVACYWAARREINATVWGAVMLCSGARSPRGPVACFKDARSRLNIMGSALLCTGAADPYAPPACYDMARNLSLSALGRATLCHSADTADGPIACYLEARAYLNVRGAVLLCGRLPYELYQRIYGKGDKEIADFSAILH